MEDVEIVTMMNVKTSFRFSNKKKCFKKTVQIKFINSFYQQILSLEIQIVMGTQFLY